MAGAAGQRPALPLQRRCTSRWKYSRIIAGHQESDVAAGPPKTIALSRRLGK
jgi:hypothetical protein